jgi:hypothetical protein
MLAVLAVTESSKSLVFNAAYLSPLHLRNYAPRVLLRLQFRLLRSDLTPLQLEREAVLTVLSDRYLIFSENPVVTQLMSDTPSSPDPFVRTERTVTKPKRKRVLTEQDKERLRKQLGDGQNRDKAVAGRPQSECRKAARTARGAKGKAG